MSFAFIRKRSKNYIVYLEYKDENSGKKIQKNNLFILIICLTEGNIKSYNRERSDKDGISKSFSPSASRKTSGK